MGVKIIGAAPPDPANLWTGNGLEVTADHAALASFRPQALGKRGATKRITCVAGGAAGFSCASNALPLGSPLFSAQWTDPTRLCIVQSIKVGGVITAASTAATLTALFDLSAYVLRSYTVPIQGSATTSLLNNNPLGLFGAQ